MVLYRISRCVYINDLSGTGTLLFGGRWSNKGIPGLYLASSRALSVLEVLVHLQPMFIPDDYCLAEIEVPDNSVEIPDLSDLPSNWAKVAPPHQLKGIGDSFLKVGKKLMLKLPSAIVPNEFNYLLNPLHPDMAKVHIMKQEPFSFDERLISSS